MNVHYTCMIVIMIMQRIMTCYMHINLSLLTFVVMWNWSGSGNWNQKILKDRIGITKRNWNSVKRNWSGMELIERN